MPDLFREDKSYIIVYLKRKGYNLLSIDGKIITPEELEQEDFNEVLISLHA